MPDPDGLVVKNGTNTLSITSGRMPSPLSQLRETANFSGDLFQLYFYLRCSILSAGLFGIFNQIDQHLLYLGTINVQSGPLCVAAK